MNAAGQGGRSYLAAYGRRRDCETQGGQQCKGLIGQCGCMGSPGLPYEEKLRMLLSTKSSHPARHCQYLKTGRPWPPVHACERVLWARLSKFWASVMRQLPTCGGGKWWPVRRVCSVATPPGWDATQAERHPPSTATHQLDGRANEPGAHLSIRPPLAGQLFCRLGMAPTAPARRCPCTLFLVQYPKPACRGREEALGPTRPLGIALCCCVGRAPAPRLATGQGVGASAGNRLGESLDCRLCIFDKGAFLQKGARGASSQSRPIGAKCLARLQFQQRTAVQCTSLPGQQGMIQRTRTLTDGRLGTPAALPRQFTLHISLNKQTLSYDPP